MTGSQTDRRAKKLSYLRNPKTLNLNKKSWNEPKICQEIYYAHITLYVTGGCVMLCN